MPTRSRPPRRRQAGFSLIELMVSLTVGLVVVAAMTAMFVQTSRARNSSDRVNRQTESGRYALQLISTDLAQAGYYDAFNPDASSRTYQAPPATKPDPCTTDLTQLAQDLSLPVQGYDSPSTNPLGNCGITDIKAGTDVLVVRRVSTCVAGPTSGAGCDPVSAGDILFQASLCPNEISAASYYKLDTNTGNLTLHQQDCATLSNYRRLQVHIYYVANNNKPNDGVPTLKRWELGAASNPVPLVDGIDDFQVEYGIDSTPGSGAQLSGDGVADAMTANPDGYNGCTNVSVPTCTQYWQAVVTADVHILARNVTANPGYQDSKTYTLGLTAAGVPNTRGPYNDGYGRHVFQGLVRLYNADARRQTQ